MITASSISYISQMLEEPQNISEADAESIRELTEKFPYFTPGRYMQAAQQHKLEPFTPEMMSFMQLFSGNWLLYNQYLQEALNGEQAEFVAPSLSETIVKKRQSIVENDNLDDIEAEPEFHGVSTGIEDDSPEGQSFENPDNEKEIIFSHMSFEGTDSAVDGFTPANTGFITGKKHEAPIQDVVEDKPAEHEPDETTDLPSVSAEPYPTAKKSQFSRPVDKAGWNDNNDTLIPPIYTEDYFLHQGMHVSNELPKDIGKENNKIDLPEPDKSLMVVMSFSEWLMFYKKKKQQAQEEEQDQKDLKTMWQKEKLAAALEEENEEIPENVFEMAVNSITKEENLASESLAEVMVKQGRYDRAIDMYKKLSLRKPQKKAYFARKIEEILKEK